MHSASKIGSCDCAKLMSRPSTNPCTVLSLASSSASDATSASGSGHSSASSSGLCAAHWRCISSSWPANITLACCTRSYWCSVMYSALAWEHTRVKTANQHLKRAARKA